MRTEARRWPTLPLGKIAKIQSGGTPDRKNKSYWIDGNIPWVTTAEVQFSTITATKEMITQLGLENSSAKIFPKGTILLALYGQGKTRGQVGLLAIDAATNQACAAIRAKPEVDTSYLYEFLKGSYLTIRGLSNSGGQENLSAAIVSEIQVPLPPLPEQRKIAAILRTWDEAIEKLEALRAAKRDRLTGLTQKLLGIGGAFPDRWKLRPLSTISTRVRRQNGGGDHPVMTIAAKSGFRLQSDKFSRDMAGSSVDRYIVLHEGEFAYNKGNSLTAPYGCIFPLDRPTALVPFVYFCFALKADLNREFFAHLFAAGALNHQLSRLINSGVRNDGLLNLNPDDFFGCKVPVPSAGEQSAIASALTAAKQEVGLLETKTETLTRQKRGLMQKLLTGEWRVAV